MALRPSKSSDNIAEGTASTARSKIRTTPNTLPTAAMNISNLFTIGTGTSIMSRTNFAPSWLAPRPHKSLFDLPSGLDHAAVAEPASSTEFSPDSLSTVSNSTASQTHNSKKAHNVSQARLKRFAATLDAKIATLDRIIASNTKPLPTEYDVVPSVEVGQNGDDATENIMTEMETLLDKTVAGEFELSELLEAWERREEDKMLRWKKIMGEMLLEKLEG